MKNTSPLSTALRERAAIRWRVPVAMSLGLLLLSSMAGCIKMPSVESVIVPKVAKALSDMSIATINTLNQDVTRIDAELTEVETKLGKVEQVAEPALKWVAEMKARAEREGWNSRTLEVMSDLNKLKNDQYQVVKLQFTAELLSAGLKYTSIIRISDLATGPMTDYTELRDSLKRKIDDLIYQRGVKVQVGNTIRSATTALLDQAPNWKVEKINAITYTLRGPGLGMGQGLTSGQWTYYSDSQRLVPDDQSAVALEKLLSGR